MASSDAETLFELPLLYSWELPPNASHVLVEIERAGRPPTTERVPFAPLQAEDDDVSRAMIAFVHDHVDAIGEFLFPSTSQAPQPWRFSGLSAASWNDLYAAFRRNAVSGDRLALIVQAADACRVVLDRICERPRQLLRRERSMTDLGRVDQLDDACLRWLVRQPGRTILDKAGTRQRILAVQRTSSYDTTENRVVRDFLERCRRACDCVSA